MTETTAVSSTAWQGAAVNGKFRVGKYLGGSQHSSVFIAEGYEPHPNAAVKIIPLRDEEATRLAQIKTSAELSHAHLLPIFETGQCTLGGTRAGYVLMEYAEEDLSLILPERALTEQETRDMLRPLVEVLAYLHGAGLVHGAVKPSNVMAAGDCLKLSADTVCPAGSSARSHADPHDAPEVRNGKLTPAADIWSLGMTIHEVLTQRLPQWDGDKFVLSDALPFPFPQLVRRCLATDPAQRWNVADIAACLAIGRESKPVSVPPPTSPRPRQRTYQALGIGVLLLVAGWLFFSHRSPKPATEERSQDTAASRETAREVVTEPKPSAAQPATSTLASEPATTLPAVPSSAAVSEPPAEAAPRSTTRAFVAGSVVKQVLPEVPRKAMNTITGKFKNSVRVSVDASGTVTDARMESAGPSRYFAKFSEDAAREWKFAPQGAPSTWILSFEFQRDGVTAKASQTRR